MIGRGNSLSQQNINQQILQQKVSEKQKHPKKHDSDNMTNNLINNLYNIYALHLTTKPSATVTENFGLLIFIHNCKKIKNYARRHFT